MRHLYFYAKNILTGFQTLWKLLFFFEIVTTLEDFFTTPRIVCIQSSEMYISTFFVETAKKKKALLARVANSDRIYL